ncbi:MAG: radical SAM protein [Halobacteriota archaeon]
MRLGHSKGCQLCQLGAKMVLFVTGLCNRSCYYCPLSDHRKGIDAVYANERVITKDADVLEEARSMDALGTGITGGEPLLKLNRVLDYIELLKSEFGPEHHIHLYSALAPPESTLEMLACAGLDEIRFHPPLEEWDVFSSSRYCEALEYAKELGLHAGVEIPALKPVPVIVDALRDLGGFLNLNELEFSETNYVAMTSKGFIPLKTGYAAFGSREVALEIVSGELPIYFCSSASKDRVQLRERLKRKARRLARPFDEVTDDGTLVFGVLQSMPSLKHLRGVSSKEYMVIDGEFLTSWQLALKLATNHRQLAENARIVETYPDGMTVETTPLRDCYKPKT